MNNYKLDDKYLKRGMLVAISNDTLYKYKIKMEAVNEEEKMFCKAEPQCQAYDRKKRMVLLQNLLDDTRLMINEKKKAKRLNWILLIIIVVMVVTVISLLLQNKH